MYYSAPIYTESQFSEVPFRPSVERASDGSYYTSIVCLTVECFRQLEYWVLALKRVLIVDMSVGLTTINTHTLVTMVRVEVQMTSQ